jgi:hypothetical protein
MPVSSYSGKASSCISKALGGDAFEPKMLKSSVCTELVMPCKLRRFATGLPLFERSKFIVASLRFKAPVVGIMGEMLVEPSAFRNEDREASARSNCTLCRVDLSIAFRGEERLGVLSMLLLLLLLFSCPANLGLGEDGGEREELEFPESGVALKARFNGLLGDARVRVMREGGIVFEPLAIGGGLGREMTSRQLAELTEEDSAPGVAAAVL